MQSGFVPGDSSVNQLVDIYNTFCKALDNGLEVRAVFCDISKAFICVWHKGLIYKLKRAGINGLLLDWLSDYLTNRKQRVVIRGGRSDWQFIRAGLYLQEHSYIINLFYRHVLENGMKFPLIFEIQPLS